MNWYIGQEVVCVKTHSWGIVRKGEEYKIQALRIGHCSNYITLDVGVRMGAHCHECNKDYDKNVTWFHEKLFAPLMDISELESILKEETINK